VRKPARFFYVNKCPPCECNTEPVTKWSFIQYRYASAKSSGLPTVPVVVISLKCFKISSNLPPENRPSNNSVCTAPGETQLTLIGFRSTASPLAMPSRFEPQPAMIVQPTPGLWLFTPLVRVNDDSGLEVMYFGTSSFARRMGPVTRTRPAF